MSREVGMDPLPYGWGSEDVRNLFSSYGALVSVDIDDGVAYARFEDERDSSRARDDVHGQRFNGDKVEVDWGYRIERRVRDRRRGRSHSPRRDRGRGGHDYERDHGGRGGYEDHGPPRGPPGGGYGSRGGPGGYDPYGPPHGSFGYNPPPPHNSYSAPQHAMSGRLGGRGVAAPFRGGRQPAPIGAHVRPGMTCHECGGLGHLWRDCPNFKVRAQKAGGLAPPPPGAAKTAKLAAPTGASATSRVGQPVTNTKSNPKTKATKTKIPPIDKGGRKWIPQKEWKEMVRAHKQAIKDAERNGSDGAAATDADATTTTATATSATTDGDAPTDVPTDASGGDAPPADSGDAPLDHAGDGDDHDHSGRRGRSRSGSRSRSPAGRGPVDADDSAPTFDPVDDSAGADKKRGRDDADTTYDNGEMRTNGDEGNGHDEDGSPSAKRSRHSGPVDDGNEEEGDLAGMGLL